MAPSLQGLRKLVAAAGDRRARTAGARRAPSGLVDAADVVLRLGVQRGVEREGEPVRAAVSELPVDVRLLVDAVEGDEVRLERSAATHRVALPEPRLIVDGEVAVPVRADEASVGTQDGLAVGAAGVRRVLRPRITLLAGVALDDAVAASSVRGAVDGGILCAAAVAVCALGGRQIRQAGRHRQPRRPAEEPRACRQRPPAPPRPRSSGLPALHGAKVLAGDRSANDGDRDALR